MTTTKRLHKHLLLSSVILAFTVFIMGCSSTTNLSSINGKAKGLKFVKANLGKVTPITRSSDNTAVVSSPTRSFTLAQTTAPAQPVPNTASVSTNEAVVSTLSQNNIQPTVTPAINNNQAIIQTIKSANNTTEIKTDVTKVKAAKPKGNKTKMILLGVLAYIALGGAMATAKHLSDKKNNTANYGGGCKSWLAALLLCFFLGGLGIHRFYLGYIWQGVVQLLTGGGCGIWALIDFIRIIIKDLQPKDGDYC